MTLTITTQTVIILISVIVAIVGWVIAYKEYTTREADTIKHIDHVDILTKEVQKSKSDLEARHHEDVKSLLTTIQDLKDKHALEISNLTDIKESELIEAENLVRGRIEEIESAYKTVLNEQNETLELYEKYIRNFDAAITLSDKKIKDLDSKGLFSSDDEIGFFFNAVSGLQTVLNNFKIQKELLDKEYEESSK